MSGHEMKAWTDEQVRRYWSWYDGTYKGRGAAGGLLRLVQRFVGSRVLDAGAGRGDLIRLIPGAVGIDLEPKSPEIHKGNVTQLPFDACSFETVFACDLLEHLSDDALGRAVSEVHRVLVPGGYAIVAVPNSEPLDENVCRCPECGEVFHRFGHVRSMDRLSVKALLSGAGIEPVGTFVTNLGVVQQRFGRVRVGVLRRLGIYLPDLVAVGRKPVAAGG